MRRTDRELLIDALSHLEAIHRHLGRGDMGDDTVADAVSLRLAAAIDAASRVTAERREAIFGDDWALAWATRNRIVHGYAFVDRHIIEATVLHDLPGIENAIRLQIADV
ncbi:MAG TPA: HepT-like ribonuclease domain-containing protein [Actinomycetaceae bacterium]|nr:HepT-like ribonuclease domain-containing protein [Actinomycetaceae bacterium]